MGNQILDVIKTRRSIRRYKPEQISEEQLGQILDAGQHAPSGGNNQSCHFIVVQNKAVLNRLKELALEEFAKMEVTEDTYKSLKSAIVRSKEGNYDFTYQAPTLVIAANKRGYGNAIADCAVALENMMLAAASLDIGSCWVNQLKWLTDNERVKAYLEELGLAADELVCGGVVLGYPDQGLLAPLARTGNLVTRIC